MSVSKHRWTTIAALSAVVVGAQSTPAIAAADLHNVTYIARVDGVAPGSTATFLINDNQTSTTNLSTLPGNAFEANTVLADPSKAEPAGGRSLSVFGQCALRDRRRRQRRRSAGPGRQTGTEQQ